MKIQNILPNNFFSKKNKFIFVVVILLILVINMNESTMASLKYPYEASATRKSQILEGIKKIQIGIDEKKVIGFMGEPDEVNDTYEEIGDTEIIGKSLWYIIRRDTDKGSQIERNEVLVRITLNLDGVVTKIDCWGLDAKK